MPTPSEPVGSTVGPGFFEALRDRYIVERTIGHGGMATVYLARELRLSRPVALKVLDAGLAVELGPERFLREIATAARLQHPHILPVFESGETAGRLWYTMPYVDGESLRGRLERTPPLALSEALRIAREAAYALDHAHHHGVVHRDVKPENILLTRDGSTLVADFGIARSSDGEPRITSAGLAVGTPMYMSPEQAGGEGRLDGRSDIYSLGCVLYEMLSGAPPFTGTSPQAVAAQHLSRPAPPLRAGPPGAAAVVAKALAKHPDDRFATAVDFARALEGIGQPPARRPWPRLAVVVAALALTVAALALWRQRTRDGATVAAVASGFNRRMAPITSAEGVEEWPAWSPDGGRLAYVAEVSGFRQLFVRTLASGDDRRITHGPHDDIQPAWSPDGRSLVFVRASADSGKLEPADLNDWYSDGGDVWAVDLTSGAERRLVAGAFGPSWSPDGRRLAFDATWAGARRVWVSDAAGLNPRQLTADSSEAVVHAGPRWSPSGGRLVFRRIEKTISDIATADPTTGAIVRVTDDAAIDLDPSWSPDGRRIYFSSSRGGGLNVWRVAVGADGRAAAAPEQLTTGAGDDVEPTPSPDGHRLAFAVRGINSDLWQLPVSPSTGARAGDPGPMVVTSRVESRGAWSPDGRTVAFNSDRDGEMNLWLHDVGAGTDRRITSGPGGDYQPSWSPDGRWLAFFSARSGNSDIWSVQVADGRVVRLTDDPGMDTNPAVSPDGSQIAFLSDRGGRTDVWLMRADGSEQRRVSTTGAGGHFLRWTEDGRALVFREEIGTQIRIVKLNLADGSTTPMPSVASGGHMSWSPDQSLILDVRGHKTLYVYPVSGGPPRRVFDFHHPDIRIDYPVWSPDGRHVLFDRAAPHGGDLWVLDGIP